MSTRPRDHAYNRVVDFFSAIALTQGLNISNNLDLTNQDLLRDSRSDPHPFQRAANYQDRNSFRSSGKQAAHTVGFGISEKATGRLIGRGVDHTKKSLRMIVKAQFGKTELISTQLNQQGSLDDIIDRYQYDFAVENWRKPISNQMISDYLTRLVEKIESYPVPDMFEKYHDLLFWAKKDYLSAFQDTLCDVRSNAIPLEISRSALDLKRELGVTISVMLNNSGRSSGNQDIINKHKLKLIYKNLMSELIQRTQEIAITNNERKRPANDNQASSSHRDKIRRIGS